MPPEHSTQCHAEKTTSRAHSRPTAHDNTFATTTDGRKPRLHSPPGAPKESPGNPNQDPGKTKKHNPGSRQERQTPYYNPNSPFLSLFTSQKALVFTEEAQKRQNHPAPAPQADNRNCAAHPRPCGGFDRPCGPPPPRQAGVWVDGDCAKSGGHPRSPAWIHSSPRGSRGVSRHPSRTFGASWGAVVGRRRRRNYIKEFFLPARDLGFICGPGLCGSACRHRPHGAYIHEFYEKSDDGPALL